MIVDGEALVHRLARQARALPVERIVVVVSPTNAAAVADVIESNMPDVRYVMQPTPVGPGDALMRGLEACRTQDVLVLLGDNIIQDSDLKKFNCCESTTVGMRRFRPGDEAMVEKLTRLREDGTTVEKTPVTGEDLWSDGGYRTWYGPLLVNRQMAWDTLYFADDPEGELYIGPFIPQFGQSLVSIEVDAHDVGYR